MFCFPVFVIHKAQTYFISMFILIWKKKKLVFPEPSTSHGQEFVKFTYINLLLRTQNEMNYLVRDLNLAKSKKALQFQIATVVSSGKWC